jgi:6-methylsalicylate decarboxylase
MYGVTLPPWSHEQHLEVMDIHGINVGLASVTNVHELLIGRQGQAHARAINEEGAALIAAHPTRFGGFATVPMDNMDAALEEMAYAVDVLGLDRTTNASRLFPRFGASAS